MSTDGSLPSLPHCTLILNHNIISNGDCHIVIQQHGWDIWDHLHKPSKAVARNKKRVELWDMPRKGSGKHLVTWPATPLQ